MEIKIKIEAEGLEAAIHTLAQVLANYDLPVNAEEVKREPYQTCTDPAPKKEGPKKETPKQEEPKEDKKEESLPEISLETVRVKLAELAQSGKQKEVKALISSLGANKLSDVPEEKYPELLEKAAGI